MIKKFLLIFMILCSVAGCNSDTAKQDDRIQIVCTSFAQYDWTRELTKGAEDMFNITLLTDNGTDIHSYQSTADDIIRISSCDMLIYTGGESEGWVLDAAKNNPDIKIINMLSLTKEREHHGHAPDEHTWLSVKDSISICNEISNALQELLPEQKTLLPGNAKLYTDSLKALDEKYTSAINDAKRNVLVFADRFPFSRMTEDYGIDCYAAFPGCSAETEASFETVKKLASAVDENDIKFIMITDNSRHDLAKTVIENTAGKNQEILSLNSMQTVTKTDLETGLNYLDVMEENLETLKTALN